MHSVPGFIAIFFSLWNLFDLINHIALSKIQLFTLKLIKLKFKLIKLNFKLIKLNFKLRKSI